MCHRELVFAMIVLEGKKKSSFRGFVLQMGMVNAIKRTDVFQQYCLK